MVCIIEVSKLVGIVVVSIIEVLISWGCCGQYYRMLISWGCGGQYYKSVN